MKTRKTKYTVVEVTEKNTFTLNDLKTLNPNIKVPTLTAFLNRQRKLGRYVSVGKKKLTCGRGKPTNLYKMVTDVVLENKTVLKVNNNEANLKSEKGSDPVYDLKTEVINKINKQEVNSDALTKLVSSLKDK